MINLNTLNSPQWYAVQTLTNQEDKAKQYFVKFIKTKAMEKFIFDLLVPVEKIIEVKGRKKTHKMRKFYPGYIFINVILYDRNGSILQEPWHFITHMQGVIKFVGSGEPLPITEKEMGKIINRVHSSNSIEIPKINCQVGEEVKINNGPFINLVGRVDEIDEKRGRLTVSVSIFGRFTPVDLEYWQVESINEI